MNMKATPVTNPWETLIQGLQAKKYDVILGSMAITEERLKAVSSQIRTIALAPKFL